jgi:hypothetical protein
VGTDEGQLRVAARGREAGVLGEEAVARMDGGRAGAPRHIDDAIDVQVALRGLAWAEVEGLVSLADVTRLPVAVREHGDGRDAHFTARTNDPDGDLAAVGNQDFHGNCP